MTTRTSEFLATHAFDIDRVTIDVETGGHKTRLMVFAKPVIPEKLFVRSNPFDVLDGKVNPAIRAGRFCQQLSTNGFHEAKNGEMGRRNSKQQHCTEQDRSV